MSHARATTIDRKETGDGRELKIVALGDAKAIDEGNGGLTGYLSVFGVLDSAGDIVVPGAYVKTTPQFLANGWLAPDHEWGVKEDLGLWIDAIEDDYGWLVTAEFHPTDDAQRVRTKVANRIAKGKSVKMSIGYSAINYEFVSGKDAVAYLIDPTPEEIAACEARSRVRILKEIHTYEGSLVSVPANSDADVVSVKSAPASKTVTAKPEAKAVETKGQYLGEYVAGELAYAAFMRLCDMAMWRVLYDAFYNDQITVDERVAIVRGGMTEIADYMEAIIRALFVDATVVVEPVASVDAVETEPAGGSTEPMVSMAAAGHESEVEETKAFIAARKESALALEGAAAERTMVAHTAAVVDAMKGYADRLKSLAAIRTVETKEGRVLKGAIRDRLSTHADAAKSIAEDLKALLDETEAEKSSNAGIANAPVMTATKEADVTTTETAPTETESTTPPAPDAGSRETDTAALDAVAQFLALDASIDAMLSGDDE